MKINKQNLFCAGKIKSLYTTEDKNLLIMEFWDDITAFNGIKHETLTGKGQINQQINAYLMTALNQAGIPMHFERSLGDNLSLVKRLDMMPIKSIMRNIAAGRFCRYIGVATGRKLVPPLHT